MEKKVTNILYLSYDGMTDPLGQSQVLPYLKGLSAKGFTIHLISFEKKDRFEKYKEQIEQICTSANIHWHPLSYTKKPPLLSTLKDVRKMRTLAIKIVKKEKIQIVHCRNYLSALVGLFLKKNFQTKFLFDMRGFWADERVDGKIWSLKNPVFSSVYRYFKKQEIKFFQQADHIVSLTENGKNEILSWKEFKGQNLPFSVIPCCVDLDLFDLNKIDLSEQLALKTSLGIQDEPVLGYVGSIGTWYMLPEMLDFFKVWQSKNEKGKFLFVTNEHPDTIGKEAKAKSIRKEDIIVQSCAHQDVPKYISLFDYSVFFIRPTYSKKGSSPTKQGEIMAMGVPLICNAGVGDTDKIVLDNKAGIVLESCSKKHYEGIDYQQTWDKNKLREGAKSIFDLEKGVKEYADIYNRLCKKSSS